MAEATIPMLTTAQVARVDQAISDAERNTSGEIVAIVSPRSRIYFHAAYEAGLFGAGAALILATGGTLLAKAFGWIPHGGLESNGGWPTWHIGIYCAITILGFLGGFFATRIDGVERFFAGDRMMEAESEERAQRLFLQHNVFATQHRTGVLLYVSLFEHMVVVLGDRAISAKIAPGDYAEVVEAIIKKTRAGKLEEGLIDGIQLLGVQLAAHFPKTEADVDELPDRLYLL
jgi:putative membrane protein